MITNFDNTLFTPEMLKHEWWRSTERLKSLLYAGWTLEEILNLANYIYESPMALTLYPGTSIGKLLISKPINGFLNYNQTLSITPDLQNNKIHIRYFKFINEDLINREIVWYYECTKNNLIEKFNEFMNWNNDWK